MQAVLRALEKRLGRCKTQPEAPHSQTRRHKDGMKALGGSARDCATTASEWRRSTEAVAIRAEVGMDVSFFLFLSPGKGREVRNVRRCLGVAMDGKTESVDSMRSLARRRDVSSGSSARHCICTQRSTELQHEARRAGNFHVHSATPDVDCGVVCVVEEVEENLERGHVDSKGGGQGLAVIKGRESPGVSRGV